MSVSLKNAFCSEWFRLWKRRFGWISVIIVIAVGFAGAVAPRLEEKIRSIQRQVEGVSEISAEAANAFVYFATGVKGAAVLTALFVALAAAGAVAGEAASGTLRISLARPIERGRLFFGKFLSLAVYLNILLLCGTAAAFAGGAAVGDYGPAVQIIIKSSTATLLQYSLLAFFLCELALFAVLGFSLCISTLARNASSANAVALGFLVLCALLTFGFEAARPYLFAAYAASPLDTLRAFAMGQNAPRPVWFGMATLQNWADVTFAALVPASSGVLFTFTAARIFVKKDWLS